MTSSRSFLSRIMDRVTGREATENDRAAVARGERLINVIESGAFDVLVTEILDPMEQEAFQAFKKLDPSSPMDILQAQKVAQVIEQIKRRIMAAVEEARAAKFRIENSTPEGGRDE